MWELKNSHSCLIYFDSGFLKNIVPIMWGEGGNIGKWFERVKHWLTTSDGAERSTAANFCQIRDITVNIEKQVYQLRRLAIKTVEHWKMFNGFLFTSIRASWITLKICQQVFLIYVLKYYLVTRLPDREISLHDLLPSHLLTGPGIAKPTVTIRCT